MQKIDYTLSAKHTLVVYKKFYCCWKIQRWFSFCVCICINNLVCFIQCI